MRPCGVLQQIQDFYTSSFCRQLCGSFAPSECLSTPAEQKPRENSGNPIVANRVTRLFPLVRDQRTIRVNSLNIAVFVAFACSPLWIGTAIAAFCVMLSWTMRACTERRVLSEIALTDSTGRENIARSIFGPTLDPGLAVNLMGGFGLTGE